MIRLARLELPQSRMILKLERMWQKKVALSFQTLSKWKVWSWSGTSSSPQVSSSIRSRITSWKCLLLRLQFTIPSIIHLSLTLSYSTLLNTRRQSELRSAQKAMWWPSSMSVSMFWTMLRDYISPRVVLSCCRICMRVEMKKTYSLWLQIFMVTLSQLSSFTLKRPLAITMFSASTRSSTWNLYSLQPCWCLAISWKSLIYLKTAISSKVPEQITLSPVTFLMTTVTVLGASMWTLCLSEILTGNLKGLPLKRVLMVNFPITASIILSIASSLLYQGWRVSLNLRILGSLQASRQAYSENGKEPSSFSILTCSILQNSELHWKVKCDSTLTASKNSCTLYFCSDGSLKTNSLAFSFSSFSRYRSSVIWQLVRQVRVWSKKARCFYSCTRSISINYKSWDGVIRGFIQVGAGFQKWTQNQNSIIILRREGSLHCQLLRCYSNFCFIMRPITYRCLSASFVVYSLFQSYLSFARVKMESDPGSQLTPREILPLMMGWELERMRLSVGMTGSGLLQGFFCSSGLVCRVAMFLICLICLLRLSTIFCTFLNQRVSFVRSSLELVSSLIRSAFSCVARCISPSLRLMVKSVFLLTSSISASIWPICRSISSTPLVLWLLRLFQDMNLKYLPQMAFICYSQYLRSLLFDWATDQTYWQMRRSFIPRSFVKFFWAWSYSCRPYFCRWMRAYAYPISFSSYSNFQNSSSIWQISSLRNSISSQRGSISCLIYQVLQASISFFLTRSEILSWYQLILCSLFFSRSCLAISSCLRSSVAVLSEASSSCSSSSSLAITSFSDMYRIISSERMRHSRFKDSMLVMYSMELLFFSASRETMASLTLRSQPSCYSQICVIFSLNSFQPCEMDCCCEL